MADYSGVQVSSTEILLSAFSLYTSTRVPWAVVGGSSSDVVGDDDGIVVEVPDAVMSALPLSPAATGDAGASSSPALLPAGIKGSVSSVSMSLAPVPLRLLFRAKKNQRPDEAHAAANEDVGDVTAGIVSPCCCCCCPPSFTGLVGEGLLAKPQRNARAGGGVGAVAAAPVTGRGATATASDRPNQDHAEEVVTLVVVVVARLLGGNQLEVRDAIVRGSPVAGGSSSSSSSSSSIYKSILHNGHTADRSINQRATHVE